MTRDQIKKVSKEASKRAADPKGGRPASAKHLARLAELKQKKRAKALATPVVNEERKRA